MKIFRDLFIDFNGYDLDNFVAKLAENCNKNWNRAIEREENAKYFNEKKIFSFEYKKDDGLPYAELALYEKDKDTLYVSNIFPVEIGQFTIDEYNRLLIDFKESIVVPTFNNLKIPINKIELTKDELLLDEVVGKDAVDVLKIFSNSANKSTGNIHPNDAKRWHQFLYKAHDFLKDKKEDDLTNLLEDTLINQGWSEKWANDLASQFEHGLALLNDIGD